MISRRKFFRYLLWVTIIPLLVVVDNMLKQYKILNKSSEVKVVKDLLANGVNFFDGFIIIRQKQNYKAFSSKCTHLGCSINKADGKILVCPCHGSQYNTEGDPVKGPANKPLQKLDFEDHENELVVKVKR